MKVQSEVAEFTRVCSYDRAGYGWSDPGPEPRTVSEISKELKVVLDAASEKGPFVLVGHSFGGFIVRVFTHLYPGVVAGVVLVDASHEDEDDRINALLPEAVKAQEKKKDEWDAKGNGIMTPIHVYLGIQRLELAMGWSGSSRLSKEQRQELSYLRQQSKASKAILSESAAWAHSAAEVRAAGGFGERGTDRMPGPA
jgi:pimeloyl-ACP methyl ester carboxylesterase